MWRLYIDLWRSQCLATLDLILRCCRPTWKRACAFHPNHSSDVSDLSCVVLNSWCFYVLHCVSSRRSKTWGAKRNVTEKNGSENSSTFSLTATAGRVISTHTHTDRQTSTIKRTPHHSTSWQIIAGNAQKQRTAAVANIRCCKQFELKFTHCFMLSSNIFLVISGKFYFLFARFCNIWWWPSSVYQFLCQAGLKFEENMSKTSYVLDSICWHNIIAKSNQFYIDWVPSYSGSNLLDKSSLGRLMFSSLS